MPTKETNAPQQKTVRHGLYRAQIKATLICAIDHNVAPAEALADLAMTIETGAFWDNLKAAKDAGGWRNMSASYLGLPSHITNSLRDAGINTAGEIADLSRPEIRRTPNLGTGAEAKIAIALACLPRI